MDFSILPLNDEELSRVAGHDAAAVSPGFRYLSSGLVALLSRCSRFGDLAYIETEYWGGVGTQGAAGFHAGRVCFGPKSAESGVINEALAMLGVHGAGPPDDAFERIGLGRFRTNAIIRAEGRKQAEVSTRPSGSRQGGRIAAWVLGVTAIAALAAVAFIVAVNMGVEFRLPQ